MDINELTVCGYYRDIFQKDIPNDIYTVCYAYNQSITDLLMYLTKIKRTVKYNHATETTQFTGFGVYNDITKRFIRFDCTDLKIRHFSKFCFIANITQILNTKNIDFESNNKQLHGIFCIEGQIFNNQTGNKHYAPSNTKRNTYLFFYDPNKIYEPIENDKPFKFEYILASSNESSFESSMINIIFCGDKYGIIYEANGSLYQLKLQNINGNQMKFDKLESDENGFEIVFPDWKHDSYQRHSLNIIYLNKLDKIFALRNVHTASDGRGRRLKNKGKQTLFEIPCGLYDLKTNKWEQCNNFAFEAPLTRNSAYTNFDSSMVYNPNEKRIYAFCSAIVKAYDLNEKEWIKTPSSFTRSFGYGLVCKYDSFRNDIQACYTENGDKPRLTACNLNNKEFEWVDLEFPDEIKNDYTTTTFIA